MWILIQQKGYDVDTDTCIICSPSPENLLLKETRGVVLLDDPVRIGHVLVGASQHINGLHELPPQVAGDVLSLASEVASKIVSLTGAQKVYVAAIGDKDKHFHVHLVPRYPEDANLGPYIFGSSGWVSTFGIDASQVSAEDLHAQIAR
jgi:diadenosine tetraphosphate (Ap4A) HIT family hydrolase